MVIDELLASIKQDAAVREIAVGPFWTAVVSRGCGIAATTLPLAARSEAHVANAGQLAQRSAIDLARLARSGSPLEASIGVATMNSLLPAPATFTETKGSDLVAEWGKGKRVAVVGHFPFVSRLKDIVEKLWVLELRPREGDLDANHAKDILPNAEIVVITGTTMINHTIDEVLGLCHYDAKVLLMGPTTPLSPLLFDYGIDVLCGVLPEDPSLVVRCVGQGAVLSQIRGLRTVSVFKDESEVA